MKNFLHGMSERLKEIIDQDTATKGRTLQFRMVVAMLMGFVIILITYSVTKYLLL